MIDAIAKHVNADANLVRRGRFVNTTFMIAIDNADTLIRIEAGRVTSVTPGPFITPNYSFRLSASRDVWEKFWRPLPPLGFTDIFALVKQKLLRVEGDLHPFMSNLLYFKDVLAAGRPKPAASGTVTKPGFEPITGRYLNLNLLGKPHRLYVEEAGTGIPLLCLHTAGADGRQYRGLMNDARVTKNFRVIAFDMPWHGKSSPPVGWQDGEYQLSSRDYVRMICEVSDALGLDKPVAMGCSIGGRIVLHLAHEHPEKFRALIGLESAAHTEPYYDLSWLNRPDVHGGMVSAGVVSGLVAPTAPSDGRWETLWHYMQSGPGIFKGDLYFYMIDGDIRSRVDEIDIKKCPLFLLTGEYDYSCTPEATLDIAKRTGAQALIMKDLGHFPMSENPEKFIGYLLPVLEKISAQ
ncbi:MAG: alpha/beta hydrolase [Pseudolabrys sp.]